MFRVLLEQGLVYYLYVDTLILAFTICGRNALDLVSFVPSASYLRFKSLSKLIKESGT